MVTSFQIAERITLTAPLGIRFWDVATGARVREGLIVMAYPGEDRRASSRALPNRSGTYVLHHANGLRQFEMGLGGSFTESSLGRHQFTVEVRDQERNFVPLKFHADLPCKGLFRWPANVTARTSLDPPPDHLSVPLYSSILRAHPAGMAAIRFELYEAPGELVNGVRLNRPAAWAMLEAHFEGRLMGRGIADAHGRVMLIFAYPEPRTSSASSSSPAGAFTSGPTFLQQAWPIELQAYYEPTVLSSPSAPLSPPAPPASPGEEANIPNLKRVLEQSPVNLFLDDVRTQPLTEVVLRLGSKVLLTPSSSPLSSPLEPEPLSILFVDRAV